MNDSDRQHELATERNRRRAGAPRERALARQRPRHLHGRYCPATRYAARSVRHQPRSARPLRGAGSGAGARRARSPCRRRRGRHTGRKQLRRHHPRRSGLRRRPRPVCRAADLRRGGDQLQTPRAGPRRVRTSSTPSCQPSSTSAQRWQPATSSSRPSTCRAANRRPRWKVRRGD